MGDKVSVVTVWLRTRLSTIMEYRVACSIRTTLHGWRRWAVLLTCILMAGPLRVLSDFAEMHRRGGAEKWEIDSCPRPAQCIRGAWKRGWPRGSFPSAFNGQMMSGRPSMASLVPSLNDDQCALSGTHVLARHRHYYTVRYCTNDRPNRCACHIGRRRSVHCPSIPLPYMYNYQAAQGMNEACCHRCYAVSVCVLVISK